MNYCKILARIIKIVAKSIYCNTVGVDERSIRPTFIRPVVGWCDVMTGFARSGAGPTGSRSQYFTYDLRSNALCTRIIDFCNVLELRLDLLHIFNLKVDQYP